MLNRIMAACIIGFWLVMNALLLRLEISPDKSKIIEIPPSYVLKLMFRHAQPSELNVFEYKKPIGSLSLRPQPARDDSRRMVDFSGHLLVGLPLAARKRVTWDGSLEMSRQLEVQMIRFNSKAQGSDYTTHLAVDAPRRLVNFSVSLKDKVADTRSVSLDDLTKSGFLSQLGLDDSLLAGIKQRVVAPVVSASASELAIGGEKVDAYRLTVRQDGSMLAEIYVSQLGQVLEVRTPFGYTLSSQSAPP
jgi:hypothetical protein